MIKAATAARWTGRSALLPAVNFHANDGSSPEKITQQVIANQTIALKQNMFSREGYVFVGWVTSAGGEVCYQDQASIGAPESGNLDLYAVWQRLYQLHFQVTPADAQFTLYADDAHKQRPEFAAALGERFLTDMPVNI